MPPVRGSAPPALSRYVTTMLVATMVIASGALYGLVEKATPSGESATRNIWCARSSSGSGLCIREDGSVNASGSYLTNGVDASGISQSTADIRYVNFDGDTMTGKLVINLKTGTDALEVIQIMSGATVAAAGGDIVLAPGSYTFNENSKDVDTRFESDGNVNMFFIDASANRIGILTNAPKATLDVPGTVSGSVVTTGGRPLDSQKCGSVLLFGSGSDVVVGTRKAAFPLSFSGSLVKVHANHGTAGAGLTTYDVNINGTSRLSTKLTVDGSETTSETATPAVITTPKFAQWQVLTIDVDSIVSTAAKESTITLCFEPDSDGFTRY